MNAAIQFTTIGWSIVAWIQSVPSAINNHITATMNAGINAAQLNASVGCRKKVSTIGGSINFCIQSISSSCYYCNKAKLKQACMQPNWMQVFDADKCLPVLNAA